MRLNALLLIATLTGTSAWVLPTTRSIPARPSSELRMALNYNDPVVAEEFTKVQPMPFEDVEAELQGHGIRVPSSMNEMDVKLMLVEMRLMMSGKLNGKADKEKKRPATFSNKFEEALWTKPAFEEFYNDIKNKGDQNSMNVVIEYLNNKEVGLQRYGKDYKALLRKCDEALTAPPPVNSPSLTFSGFPANMGEAGCKMTFESLGTVTEFECEQDEDFPILKGKITFEDIEAAKKAVAQYDGMDMGIGQKLSLSSV